MAAFYKPDAADGHARAKFDSESAKRIEGFGHQSFATTFIDRRCGRNTFEDRHA